MKTLKTTTALPTRYLNTISQSGTINEGKIADLVLLEKKSIRILKTLGKYVE